VFIHTDRHAEVSQYAADWAVTLPAPSDDSRLLAKTAAWCLAKETGEALDDAAAMGVVHA
jgi:hypothetical protein